MAEKNNEKDAGGKGLLTLTEVSERTGISMPTLQRYKKLYQARIPSVGKGRRQRYAEASLAVFEQLKSENLGRRGRPRKSASAAKAKPGRPRKAAAAAPAPTPAAPARRGRKPAAAAPPVVKRRPGRPAKVAAPAAEKPAAKRGPKPGGLLTLTKISKLAGVSYPTAVRYVRLFLDKLPHEGEGRRRRFYPGAVDAFRQLREEGGRGGRRVVAGGRRAVAAVEGAIADRVKQIEKAQQSFEKKLRGVVESLQKLLG
ncbi:MAG TPA: helix-turn-helix domain-containing protein [Thermoanaerobaculia bacterium]|nr:helix-turn-helix domain-containing protein [Thermoanaerobaculia bacterium]